MGSSPNFRGASALLRGSSRAFSPKRASRDAPSVCLTGEGSATPPRRPLPSGLGAAFFQSQSFTRFFPKNRGFQRQSLWSLIAMSEIPYPVKRFFRVNCRDAARGGFLQVKKPPCRKKSTQFLAYPASPDYEYRFKDFPCIFHNYVLL